MDLFEDQSASWALRRGERHGDFDPLAWEGRSGVWVGVRDDVVNQAQIDEIEFDFRVEAVAQCHEDVFPGKEWQLFEAAPGCQDQFFRSTR